MELVYLWVEDYKNIKKQGFNFSPRFRCDYNPENNELKIEENKNYIENFFGENINITAIVGKNGSGKSSILEILFNKYDYQTLEKGLFFIYFDTKNSKLIFLGANKINLENNKYKIELISSIKEPLNNTKTIYFSNILNENDLFLPTFQIDIHHTHSVNISTTHRLSQMKLIETSSVKTSVTSFDKIYRSYRIQQILNSSILIKDKAIEIPFELPKTITIKNIDFRTYLRTIRDKFTDNNYNYRKILEILDRNNSDDSLLDFRNYLSVNLIISLLLENINSNNPIINELLENVLNMKMHSSLEYFYDNVKSKIYNEEWNVSGEYINAPYIDNFFNLSDKLIEKVDNIISESSNSQRQITLNIDSTDFDFLETYEKLIQQSEYFWDISFDRGLSSGEENYLYQFSRFHQLSKGFKDNSYLNLKINNEEVENLIFLIDEGEDTMHPRWQKNYIDYLTKFFSSNFNQNIHLIVTSHSPFIVSDLPKDNVVFIEDSKQKKEIIEQSFGANIHSLLSHGFFMDKKGLIGKFAKNKIQEVIDFLNGNESPIEDANSAKQIIDIVGEPFLQMQLRKMYNQKFSTELEIDKQINELKRELKGLEDAKNRSK